MKSLQLQLFAKPSLEHGGETRVGKRKIARPFTPKKAMHLTFRSSKATGDWSFLHRRNKLAVHLYFVELLEKWQGTHYNYANVGNHLHAVVRFKSRRQFRAFLREFTQKVMFQVTKARKGAPQGRFFDQIVYSRVVEWGKAFKTLKDYLWKNKLEALGFSSEAICELRALNRRMGFS
jgi:hypothetical protein